MYSITQMIKSLACVPNCDEHIDILIFALYHVSVAYRDIRPYGRVEPLNNAFTALAELTDNSRHRQSQLLERVIGLLAAQTKQLEQARLHVPVTGQITRTQMLSIVAVYRDALAAPDIVKSVDDQDPWS